MDYTILGVLEGRRGVAKTPKEILRQISLHLPSLTNAHILEPIVESYTRVAEEDKISPVLSYEDCHLQHCVMKVVHCLPNSKLCYIPGLSMAAASLVHTHMSSKSNLWSIDISFIEQTYTCFYAVWPRNLLTLAFCVWTMMVKAPFSFRSKYPRIPDEFGHIRAPGLNEGPENPNMETVIVIILQCFPSKKTIAQKVNRQTADFLTLFYYFFCVHYNKTKHHWESRAVTNGEEKMMMLSSHKRHKRRF